MTAALAALLLALAALTGASLPPEPAATLLVAPDGGDRPSGSVVEDARSAVAWTRSVSVKSNRVQGLAGGGATSGDSAPDTPLAPSGGFAESSGAAAKDDGGADLHAEASGRLTRRTPTGPPSLPSRAV